MTHHVSTQLRRSSMFLLAFGLGIVLSACASEPPQQPEPVPEPVQQPAPEPAPKPDPTYSVNLEYPDGPVTFTSRCDYSPYIDALRSVHSSDRNVHAVLAYVENGNHGCSGRVAALEDYLRNLDAL